MDNSLIFWLGKILVLGQWMTLLPAGGTALWWLTLIWLFIALFCLMPIFPGMCLRANKRIRVLPVGAGDSDPSDVLVRDRESQLEVYFDIDDVCDDDGDVDVEPVDYATHRYQPEVWNKRGVRCPICSVS